MEDNLRWKVLLIILSFCQSNKNTSLVFVDQCGRIYWLLRGLTKGTPCIIFSGKGNLCKVHHYHLTTTTAWYNRQMSSLRESHPMCHFCDTTHAVYNRTREPLMEDDFWRKMAFNGRWSLMVDELQWKTTFGGRKQRFWTKGSLNWSFTLKTKSFHFLPVGGQIIYLYSLISLCEANTDR